MRLPAAQNPFCWHWRPSVRGTLMSHLIPGVDSPVPGPGPASELAWRLFLKPGRLAGGPKLSGSLRPPHRDGRLCTPAGDWEGAGVCQSAGSFSCRFPSYWRELLAQNSELNDNFHFSVQVETNRTETSSLFCLSVSDSVSEAPGSWSPATRPAQAAAEGGVTTGEGSLVCAPNELSLLAPLRP